MLWKIFEKRNDIASAPTKLIIQENKKTYKMADESETVAIIIVEYKEQS